jgi:methyl-accepting chemotaxis protein
MTNPSSNTQAPSIKDFSIRNRLIAVSSLFLVPICLLFFLFVNKSMQEISFASKEADGVVYLRPVWNVLNSAIDADLQGSNSVNVEGIRAVAKQYDEAMATAKASADVVTAAASTQNKAENIAKAAQDLVSGIGNGSNLILDPDLDSFYVMDSIVVQIPNLVSETRKVSHAASDLLAKSDADAGLKMMMAAATLEKSADNMLGNLQTALANTKDKQAVSALNNSFNALREKQKSFSTQIIALYEDARSSSKDLSKQISELKADAVKINSAANTAWNDGARALETLLNARMSGNRSQLWITSIIALLFSLGAAATAIYMIKSILGNVSALQGGIKTLADQSLDAEVPGVNGKGEIAQIAQSVQYFRDQTVKKIAEANSEERQREIMQSQRSALQGVADQIRASVGDTVGTLRDCIALIMSSTQTVAANASTTNGTAEQACIDLRTAVSDVQTVMQATQELSLSISEISQQTQQAVRQTDEATARAEGAKTVATQLAEATDRIGHIAALINGIAQQTNLLALNATIEAARAGEAGRGFAIVAQEVKSLAAQTSRATEDIERQVTDIQSAVSAVNGEVDSMASAIRAITTVSSSIASAIEEQNAVTSGISGSVQRAADGAGGVMNSIEGLPALSQQTEDASRSLADLAHALDDQANTLTNNVNYLLEEITGKSSKAA